MANQDLQSATVEYLSSPQARFEAACAQAREDAMPGDYLCVFAEVQGVDTDETICGLDFTQISEICSLLRERGLRMVNDDVGLKVV